MIGFVLGVLMIPLVVHSQNESTLETTTTTLIPRQVSTASTTTSTEPTTTTSFTTSANYSSTSTSTATTPSSTSTSTATTTTTTLRVLAACTESDASWLAWSEWSTCSDDCGSCGVHMRTRTCLTTNAQCVCEGQSTLIEYCNLEICRYPRSTCCYNLKVTSHNGIFACLGSNSSTRVLSRPIL
uniref:ShKT domain-containing protein n=1 Tax=Haemonchus contortus TaxID=6289 RepID=A0A7I4YAC3_HAECO